MTALQGAARKNVRIAASCWQASQESEQLFVNRVRKSKCQLLGVAAGKGAELRKTYHWIPDSPNRAPICCGQPGAAGFKPNNCLYLNPASSSGPRCSSQIQRTIVRIYPTPEPESPGCSYCQHRTNVRITDAAGPKPEHFCQQDRCA